MKTIGEIIEKRPWVGWALFTGTLAAVFTAGVVGASIAERRGEAALTRAPKADIKAFEPRNEIWGKSYPREFERYIKTAESDKLSQHGGSAPIDNLERYPDLVVLWAGYAFSHDYNQGRGHYRAVEDIRNTLRTAVPEYDDHGKPVPKTGFPQPGTCWTCKSPDVPRLMNEMGVKEFYKAKWSDLGSQVVNNIGCADCHDPKTMNLTITRPALVEAFARQGKDIKKATHQEMRSLVCAQCHVEYYFKGKEEKYLTFPWDKGMSVESMEKYYDEVQHVDFVHTLSKAPILKAQHPDYEVFSTGIHAERGVSCADCHMPYRSEGGVKFTDHHITSPLQNPANSCGVCHRESEATLMKNVFDRQNKVAELLHLAQRSLAAAHIEAKAAWDAGATEAEMKSALTLIRHAQWRWDYIAAANGVGFHSPVESARILGTSIAKSAEARAAVARVLVAHGKTEPVSVPEFKSKEEAQRYIGLDPEKLKAKKKAWADKTLPEWDKAAAERQAKMDAPAAPAK